MLGWLYSILFSDEKPAEVGLERDYMTLHNISADLFAAAVSDNKLYAIVTDSNDVNDIKNILAATGITTPIVICTAQATHTNPTHA